MISHGGQGVAGRWQVINSGKIRMAKVAAQGSLKKN